MAIKNTSFAKGEAVQKLIEVIARVNNKSVSDDATLQAAINEVREMFKTDELTECTMDGFVALRDASQLEPGHRYKISNMAVKSLAYGGAIDTVEINAIVTADTNNLIVRDIQGLTANDVLFTAKLGLESDGAYAVKEYFDEFNNHCNFYLPASTLEPSTSVCNNIIMLNTSMTDCAIKGVTTFKNNKIESPKSLHISTGAVVDNVIKIGAKVHIDGDTSAGKLQMNEFGAACDVNITAGICQMNKFGAASNVSIIAATDCEVSMNIFGDRCSVSAGASQPLQLCQMNHVGFASTTVWELAAAGNTIEDNCSNIKLVYAMRNFFAVQCSNITLSGDATNGPCMSNKFGYGCGADGAIVLGAGSGANIFGIQCNNCTLGMNVTGCIFEGLNMVAVPAGFQMYTVKLGVGATGKVTLSQYKNYSGQGFRINVSHKVTGGLIYWTDEEALAGGTDNFIGTNTVTTVAGIPVTKSTVLANLTAGGAVSFATGLAAGREVYVIAKNTGTDPITLTFTDANVESVELAAGARAEFSVISIAGTYYVRVGVDSAAGAAVEEISAEEVAAKFA